LYPDGFAKSDDMNSGDDDDDDGDWIGANDTIGFNDLDAAGGIAIPPPRGEKGRPPLTLNRDELDVSKPGNDIAAAAGLLIVVILLAAILLLPSGPKEDVVALPK
jgi:hypothetical protein